MSIGPAPICAYCARLNRAPGATSLTCTAYPSDIPDAIIDGFVDHRTSFPGDHGVHFAPRTDVTIDGGMPPQEVLNGFNPSVVAEYYNPDGSKKDDEDNADDEWAPDDGSDEDIAESDGDEEEEDDA